MLSALLVPLRTSMLAALCLIAALTVYLHQQAGLRLGVVEQITAVGSDYDYLQLLFPFRDTVSVVVRHDLTQSSHVGARDLVVVRGAIAQVDKRTMLEADTVLILPWTLPRFPDQTASLAMLAWVPFVTILLGVAALLGGPAATRILTRLFISAMSTLIVWAGVQAALGAGWITLPEKASLVLTMLGGLVGWILSRRRLMQAGSLLHRIVTAALLWLAMPLVETCLDLPQGAGQILVVASLFVPSIAYTALGAGLIAWGAAARNGYVVGGVALACAVVVLILHFKPTSPTRRVAQDASALFRGRVPLSHLLKV